MVLLRPYLESNAEATAFFTSAEISAAHLSPIETFVPKNYIQSRIIHVNVNRYAIDNIVLRDK
jgi:hypothetical protein